MELKTKIINCKNQFYDYVTEPKRVKLTMIAGLISLILFVAIAVLIAHFYDPATVKDGYNIFIHYISDLGSVRYTSVPVLLNILWMSEAILFTPLVFYLYKKIHVCYKDEADSRVSKTLKWLLINCGFTFLVIGIIGWFWVGFFSEDEGRLLAPYGFQILGQDLHMIFSIVVFGGMVVAGVFIGIFFILYPKTVLKIIDVKLPWILLVILGLEMVIWPPLHAILFIISNGQLPFHEWFMFFALLAWLYPIGYGTLQMLKKDLAERA
ncbi:MAG: hypothetical protein ACFFBP_06490 [Promethearchaeota archaeon]